MGATASTNHFENKKEGERWLRNTTPSSFYGHDRRIEDPHLMLGRETEKTRAQQFTC